MREDLYLAGAHFHEMGGTGGVHILQRLGPAHRIQKLVERVFLDFGRVGRRIARKVSINRTRRRIKNSGFERLGQRLVGRRHERRVESPAHGETFHQPATPDRADQYRGSAERHGFE